MKKLLLVFVLVLSLVSFEVAIAGDQTILAPGTYKDWERLIDYLEIIESFQLSGSGDLIIMPLDTKNTPLPDKEDNTYQPTLKTLEQVNNIWVSRIKEKFENKMNVFLAENEQEIPKEPTKPNAMILRGRVSEMTPGSRALRYFVGFGAGKSRVEIEGELVEQATSKILLKFKHARVSAMGLFGGDYEKFMVDDANNTCKDIAAMLETFLQSTNGKDPSK